MIETTKEPAINVLSKIIGPKFLNHCSGTDKRLILGGISLSKHRSIRYTLRPGGVENVGFSFDNEIFSLDLSMAEVCGSVNPSTHGCNRYGVAP
jgi:hypothetical protein